VEEHDLHYFKLEVALHPFKRVTYGLLTAKTPLISLNTKLFLDPIGRILMDIRYLTRIFAYHR